MTDTLIRLHIFHIVGAHVQWSNHFSLKEFLLFILFSSSFAFNPISHFTDRWNAGFICSILSYVHSLHSTASAMSVHFHFFCCRNLHTARKVIVNNLHYFRYFMRSLARSVDSWRRKLIIFFKVFRYESTALVTSNDPGRTLYFSHQIR